MQYEGVARQSAQESLEQGVMHEPFLPHTEQPLGQRMQELEFLS